MKSILRKNEEEKPLAGFKKDFFYIVRHFKSQKIFFQTQILVDENLERHSTRVAELANYVGSVLDFPDKEMGSLESGAYFHDIGKTIIPHDILYRPGKLSDEEMKIMARHPYIGAGIAYQLGFADDVCSMIKNHHEPYYAFKKHGNEAADLLQLKTQIISVADALDAMLDSERTYQKQMTIDGALNRLKELSGTKFNPSLVNAFIMSAKDLEPYFLENYFQMPAIEDGLEKRESNIILN